MMRKVSEAPIGRLVGLDGTRLWVHRSDRGRPAVVFLPGAGSFGLDFWLVHERLAGLTTSVLYDRAGTGWSDDADLPRTTEQVTDELHRLLADLAVPGPYVLVGHSLGGAYAQRFAQRFPDQVRALLLLDPLHEDWDQHQPPHLKLAANQPDEPQVPELPAELLELLRSLLGQAMAGFPEPLRTAIVDRHASADRVLVGFQEGLNVLAVLDDLRRGGPRPDVPLTILSATGLDDQQRLFAPEDQLREQLRGSSQLYAAMAAAAPQGQHHSVGDASHVTLPMARPDAVADAVIALLARS